MTEYALGTVAIVTNKYGVSHPAIRTFDPNPVGRRVVWRPGITDVFYADDEVTDVRPMLLVDPQDPEALAAALKEAAGSTGFTIRTQSGRAIDDGADFTPAYAAAVLQHLAEPKPEEPTGLGAVVRVGHTSGPAWAVRTGNDGQDGENWYYSHPNGGGWRSWDGLDVTEVLSEGYTPEAKS